MSHFFKNIFSIDNNYSDERTKIVLFGISFKLVKKQYAQLRKQNTFYYYKKNNIDITTLPPATGQIRNIQLANLALLKELDFVCKQCGLNYWLDAGTLIGSIRHKGFIPWDDDIDVGMLREDYNKIIAAFNKYSRNPDIYADFYRDPIHPSMYFIKVQHKKCKHLFVDIFPFDVYGKALSTDMQLKKTIEIKKIRKTLESNIEKISNVELKEKIDYLMKTQILMQDRPEILEESDCVWGIDFKHGWNNWFTNYNVIFPLKTIEFEGQHFSCLNDPNAFLTRVYGDYMAYPKKLRLGHNSYKTFTEEENKIVQDLIKGQGLQCETI